MKGFESVIIQFPFSSKILYISDSPFLRWGNRLYQKNLILIYDTLIAEMAPISHPSLICTHCNVTLNFFPLKGRVYFSTPRIWVGLWLALAGRMCRGEAVPSSELGLNRPCELSRSLAEPCHCLENEPVGGWEIMLGSAESAQLSQPKL